ncbi:hypothetical protein GP475_10550 [Corynebacterium poyangense]|uniref:Uncharacterized protein n=1 Tax=Corynebacterium poyangense TaxID=2684405 RepID=A0A7H0SR42_9CORY|nr:hypothetical protein [Corynebacterium poyangense]MBZ8176444.1 hypothetical protein [Corynebacterium poyangense]QNQ91017.1 hypothetical protein GP475_10550 [Corynebacterium poyangense]
MSSGKGVKTTWVIVLIVVVIGIFYINQHDTKGHVGLVPGKNSALAIAVNPCGIPVDRIEVYNDGLVFLRDTTSNQRDYFTVDFHPGHDSTGQWRVNKSKPSIQGDNQFFITGVSIQALHRTTLPYGWEKASLSTDGLVLGGHLSTMKDKVKDGYVWVDWSGGKLIPLAEFQQCPEQYRGVWWR